MGAVPVIKPAVYRRWVAVSDRGVVGVETFYHPLNRIWHDQDGGETTVLSGEWTSTGRSDRYHKQRRPLVAIVRSVELSRRCDVVISSFHTSASCDSVP